MGSGQPDVIHTRHVLCTPEPDATVFLVRRLIKGRALRRSECNQSPFVESEALEIVRHGRRRHVDVQYLRRVPVVATSGDTVSVLQVQITAIETIWNARGELHGYFITLSGGLESANSYCPSGYVVLDPDGRELYAWVGVEARVGLDGTTFIRRGRPEVYYDRVPSDGGYTLRKRGDLSHQQCWPRR
jgi:hypothetical protein